MRKKLVFLMLALVATAAASVLTPAPASACNGYIVDCDPPICCPWWLTCECP
jgi:hypothetical protein